MKSSKSIVPNRETDVRPPSQRESKMNTRKGMIQKATNSHINDRNIVSPLWHEATKEYAFAEKALSGYRKLRENN